MDETRLLRVLQAARTLETGANVMVNPQDAGEAEAEGFVEIVQGRAVVALTDQGRAELERLERS